MRTRTNTAYGAALLHVLSVGTAFACPTSSDLDTGGVRFSAPDGTMEVYRRLDEARVQIDYSTPGSADVSSSIVIHGVYVQGFATFVDGTVQRDTIVQIRRDILPSQMPVPVEGLIWSGAQVFEDSAGAIDELFDIQVGPMTTWQLGDCVLDMLPVDATTRSGDETYLERINYLPALGIGVLVRYADADGVSDYVYVAVEAISP